MSNGLGQFLLDAVKGKLRRLKICRPSGCRLEQHAAGSDDDRCVKQVIVANHRAAVLLGGRNEELFTGRKLKAILRYANKGGLFDFLVG